MLEEPSAAKSVRIRNGRQTTLDGPFAETKEMIAGFNVIEAESMDEAVRIASEFPWAQTGCVEVRPIRDIDTVRERVGGRCASARAPRVVCFRAAAAPAYLKLKMSSASGRSMPFSWYSCQICAHGRPYMSGTLYSMTVPGETGVARPFTG